MTIPRPALGTAQLGMPYGIANRAGQPSPAECQQILDAAVELEIDWIDTAPAYGDAERIVGRFVRASRSWRPHVCTKTPRFESGLDRLQLAPMLGDAIERSRDRLNVETLDVLLIHGADLLREYGQVLVDALMRHRDAGRVRRIGISLYDEDELALALSYPELTATQLPFSVLHGDLVARRTIERLRLSGHQVIIRSVLHQGLLTLEPEEGESKVAGSGVWLRAYRRICAAHGLDPVAAAVEYAAGRSGADLMVVGVDSARQLREMDEHLRRLLAVECVAEIEQALTGVPPSVLDPRQWQSAA